MRGLLKDIIVLKESEGRKLVDFLNKIELIIIKIEKVLVFIFGLIMIISVALQFFSRYVLRRSVPWTEELSIISFVIMIFYGVSLASYYNRHLGIRNFVTKLTASSYKGVWFIKNIMLILFLITVMLIYFFPMAIESLNQVYTMTRIPLFYVFIQIPIFSILIIFHIIMSFLRRDYIKELPVNKNKEI
jgi:TRAP-type C4-dicarboxylate transport system permease small subunit